jgi:heme exporter protein CcmD
MGAFTGHYAAYVMPAWGLSALVLLAMTVDSLRRASKWRRAAKAREQGADV